jgi:hypothetical protein
MQSNKLRMAIRSTAAVAILGMAGQAGAITFNAGDVEASIYGYAQFNASYDMNQDLGNANYGSFGSLGDDPDTAINDEDVEGHFAATAQQSRIGFTATHTEGVKFTVEGDFNGGSGGFRLRHAFGEYNGFLAGQTWSNYNSWVGNTSILDFNAAAGNAGRQLRNAQVRYTTGPLSFSLEDPSNGGVIGTGASQKSGTPALTAKLEDSQGGLSYSVAAMAKQVSSDNGTADDSAIGYGAFGALSFKITDMISLQGAMNFVDGAGSYLYQSGMADAYVVNGSIETISGFGGAIGVGVGLDGGSSLNVGVGMTEVDWDDAKADNVAVAGKDETRQNIFANYQWSPVKNVLMAVEYSFWDAETVAGKSTDASRVMYVSRYSF